MSRIALFLLALACIAAEPRWNHPKTKPLPSDKMGPFVSVSGGILTVEETAAYLSKDSGKTWTATPMFGDRNIKISKERALLRTASGAIVAVFMNMADFKWKWEDAKREADPSVRSDVWTARSLDDGKTWIDIQMIQRGYCGAVRDIIQAKSGRIVVTAQNLVPPFPRHWTTTYSSADDGHTWVAANVLDLGGSGHHDGSIEATVEQLRDGRMWLLMRTSLDKFWQAVSTDDGQRWTSFGPSDIDASTAPGLLKRLRSGRLILLWNRPNPEGKTLNRRDGGQAYAQPVWGHRGELSMAFSEDDGRTWSTPVVIAREEGKSLAYPYLYERKPGELWITTMQGGVRLLVKEADFAP